MVICTLVLWFHNIYDSALTTLNQAFFRVAVDGDNGRVYSRSTRRRHCALAAVFARLSCYVPRWLAVAPGQRAGVKGHPWL
ncbi:hypothetical protein KCP71_05540 [Salmonella enterica subsp. enterica]|nr:hypothetical protein KCP71_05540 [Salmonella enterica subsp. enterica]